MWSKERGIERSEKKKKAKRTKKKKNNKKGYFVYGRRSPDSITLGDARIDDVIAEGGSGSAVKLAAIRLPVWLGSCAIFGI